VHQDKYGAISGVTNILAKYQLNIGNMEVSRKEKGNMAMMVIEVDQKIEDKVIHEIESLPNITQTIRMVE
jgi:L-serine dehydratase